MRLIEEIQIGNEVFEISDKSSRSNIDRIDNSIDSLISNIPIKNGKNARILSVAKNSSGQFNSINEAYEYAKTLERSISNQVVILIYPGTYNETLSGNGNDYINFVGIDKNSCIIEHESIYPQCIINMHGFNTFKNLTLNVTNNAYYCVHADMGDQRLNYTLTFDNCIMKGGKNSIGYGASENSMIILKDCELYGSQYPIYAHNSPYSNSSNQKLILENNFIGIGSTGYSICIDDSANGYGATNSYLWIFANGNSSDSSLPKLLYRQVPGQDQYNINYLNELYQIRLAVGSCGNAIKGLNYGESIYDISRYVVMPNNADTEGIYRVSIPVDVIATIYNRDLQNVTIPGVGDITTSCSIDNVKPNSIDLITNLSSVAGKSIATSIRLTLQ